MVRGGTIGVLLLTSLACGCKGADDEADLDENDVIQPAGDDDDASPSDDDDDDDEPDTTADDPRAPSILSISTNVDEITEGEAIRITAIVTDPDGIDDLIGGELLAEDGSSYGAFSTGAQEGAYEINLTWADLHAVEPITFEGSLERRVMARFYDVDGHQVQSLVTFDLSCEGGAACDGTCTALDEDPDHCGTCGNVCAGIDDFDPTCSHGRCAVESSCEPDLRKTCDEVCADDGLGPCVLIEDWSGIAAGRLSYAQCQESLGTFDDCQTPLTDVALRGGEQATATCYCAE